MHISSCCMHHSSQFPTIMKMIITRLQRFAGNLRQLHTIISQETIKPSSPTPPHFRTHNLSLVDQFAPNVHMPLIFFYKNYRHGDNNILKKSLSQTLSQYYPFAGRLLSPSALHIDCNDQGVEFLEASSDSRLDEFVLNKEQDQTLHQLIPNALGSAVNKTSPVMVQVQLNHFTCGGVAVGMSISHKVGDGFTVINFINHWATVTRGGIGISLIPPCFFSSSTSYNRPVPEFDFKGSSKFKYVTRRFVFHNSKLNELKSKVNELGASPMNPSRVEVLSSLLFISEITAGNICSVVIAKMADPSEINLNAVIAKLRKEMMELKEVEDVEEVGESFAQTLSTLQDDESRNYNFSSLCRFPFYEVDFGWGKPEQVLILNETLDGSVVHLMDTPTGDGIEATVHLEEGEMDVFRQDKEILAYAG